jgi:hypothetical protein
VTWNDVALCYPEFVQWAVARHGPLPDGEIRQEDYERLAAAYKEELGE